MVCTFLLGLVTQRWVEIMRGTFGGAAVVVRANDAMVKDYSFKKSGNQDL